MSDITNIAPVTCVTGLMGNGKTLWTVEQILAMSKKLGPDQVIYIHGIPDIQIEGCALLLDVRAWHELPIGSIIVIDEAQDVFPTRSGTSAPPEHVAKMATLRHRGHQLILITQTVGDLDKFVRGRIGRHVHFKRMSGAECSAMWDHQQAMESKADFRTANKSTYPFPKHIYPLYKSSQLHTVKFKAPRVLIYFLVVSVIAVVVVIGAIWYGKTHLDPTKGLSTSASAQPAESTSSAPSGSFATAPGVPPAGGGADVELSYLDARIPRISGLPHTAPAYDGITAPTAAPKPAACAAMGPSCRCYTQQGTRIPGMSEDLCRRIVDEGWFDESPDPVQQTRDYGPRGQVAAAPQQAAAPVTLPQVLASMPPQLAPNNSVHTQPMVTK